MSELACVPPNKPMKLTVAFGARSFSARRWADTNRRTRQNQCTSAA
jgi:hypothetical protein